MCPCNGEWCFICLEPWLPTKAHAECKHYGDPDYDADGYDERGFHRDTGFDREGFTRAGYNIRGLNRKGERVKNFATRVAGDGTMAPGHEIVWTRMLRMVDHVFAALEGMGNPEGFERFHKWVTGWLRDNEIVLPGHNAAENDGGMMMP